MSTKLMERLTPDFIDRVRDKVIKALSQVPSDDYDALDVESNIKSRNTLILMFAIQHLDDQGIKSLSSNSANDDKVLEKVAKLIVEALKWRKAIGVTSLTLNDFASDIHSHGYFKTGTSGDSNEKVTIVMNFGQHKKISAAINKMEMTYFLVFTERVTMEHFDAGREVTVIFDHTNYTLANMDPTFMLEFFNLISTYYPTIVAKTLAYELPWYLKPVVKMAKAVLPSRIMSVFFIVDRKSITQQLDSKQIPVWMGGENDSQVLSVSPTKELSETSSRFEVDESDLKKLEEYYRKNSTANDATDA